jgi:integrase/recombinase XerC
MTAAHPEASRQAVVEAALVLLERMGLSPADLAAVPHDRKPVPTFAEYVPVVSAAVSAGARRAYGSYWNRVLDNWGNRRLDEPTPSEIRQLMIYVKTHVVARRDARGGRSAEEHLVAALRCLYQRAELRLRRRRSLRRPRAQRAGSTFHGRHGHLRPGPPARG